jgi:aspartyl-tRNA(Asn)/glutamyl-tRNA(Gln) amidotransferase subunit A
MIGTYVLSHGYYDAYYLQAQKLRRMIADDFQQAFKELRPDRRPGGAHGGLEARRAGDDPAGQLPGRHLHPARQSLAGLPGMSVPVGFGGAGMPVGLQLIGNYFIGGAPAATRRTPCSRRRTSTPANRRGC